MNRAVLRLVANSRVLPRIYTANASSKTTASVPGTGHQTSGEVHHHDDHGHGHGHHHEPELRKTHAWRHHAGLQSKYENQSEDPSMVFMQERPNVHDYRPALGHVSVAVPYRTYVSTYPLWMYHAAMFISIWIWWYVAWRFVKEPSYFFGHAHYPDMSKFTDEELGIPSDDLD